VTDTDMEKTERRLKLSSQIKKEEERRGDALGE
jgi:hypothetical protein